MVQKVEVGEFGYGFGYHDFAYSVRREWRYMHDPKVEKFLSAVRKTSERRKTILTANSRWLYRTQRGCDWRGRPPLPEFLMHHPGPFREQFEKQTPQPYSKQRMLPDTLGTREGRVNPKGIPCLYLADDISTAIHEVRPWSESYVSLAQFAIPKDLTMLDCTLGLPATNDKTLCHDDIVWGVIDEAFAEPVADTDNRADYAPTQTLAELFRQQGYEGIIYKSSFGKEGKNIAIFSISNAEFVNCGLVLIRTVRCTFDIAKTNPS